MERIGIYGGTFNPPHVGHLQAAQAAVAALGLTKLLLIPDRIAPHKVLPPNSPTPEQRLEMIRDPRLLQIAGDVDKLICGRIRTLDRKGEGQ